MYVICCNPKYVCQEAYIGETSQPLQHRLRQRCQSSYDGNDSAIFKHIMSSEHQVDVNVVAILDRVKNLLRCGVKEAVWVRIKNPSLDCSSGTRIMLSHFWNRSKRTPCSFSPYPKILQVRCQPEDNANTSCFNNHNHEED